MGGWRARGLKARARGWWMEIGVSLGWVDGKGSTDGGVQ